MSLVLHGQAAYLKTKGGNKVKLSDLERVNNLVVEKLRLEQVLLGLQGWEETWNDPGAVLTIDIDGVSTTNSDFDIDVKVRITRSQVPMLFEVVREQLLYCLSRLTMLGVHDMETLPATALVLKHKSTEDNENEDDENNEAVDGGGGCAAGVHSGDDSSGQSGGTD